MHKYTYAENNPATYTDPSGKLVFVPVFLALWAVAEAALQIYDTYDLAVTLLDPCVAEWEKYMTLGLYVAGAFLPGGGYAAGGKAVLKRGDDVVREADKAYGFLHWGEKVKGQGDEVISRADKTKDRIRVVDDVTQCFVNSFSADTPVSTADGLRPISHIRLGDMVWAYDEATGITGLYTVTNTISHIDPGLIRLTLAGEVLETTAEHPFFVLGRGWVQAADLILGDRVRQIDGEFRAVEMIQLERRTLRMYNLTVAVAHTFFVGEEAWLVHNACLQTGGHTIRNSTANALNEAHDLNLHPRDWGRALEALKAFHGLGNKHHGKIMDNGDYFDATTNEYFDNLLDYLP